MSQEIAPAPLFIDPPHLAPTDPTVIEGPEGDWWMFYTQRHADDDGPGVRWVHGTDIGVATSSDGGLTWGYRHVVEGLSPESGRNTLWAPEVIWAEGRFHMFVSYIRGVPMTWDGDRRILHHVSADLLHWEYVGPLTLSSNRVIDACVYPLPDGGYRLWFKDEAHGSSTWATDSPDLTTWSACFPAILDPPHEGPNVFALGGSYWMVVDEWRGLGVYRSANLTTWERQGLILDRPGSRPWDAGVGRHADVAVGQDEDGQQVGWIFYFTHRVEPDKLRANVDRLTVQRTDVQVASLRVEHGRLVCERDRPTGLDLRRGNRTGPHS